ncbi:DUF1289 domain-containing protein [Paracoccus indicus]|uniref:DUF1289 domain-containing protein n=1 Tax=Paracoccus indicus TaxID=2079229 RepID=UPI000D3990B1|nr:DUF1289 domain-containing protein [Paracoccus indicus]
MTESPCIRICQIDPDQDLCIGCFRTLAEIAAWGSMSPAARKAVMARLPERERRYDQA